MSEVHSSARRAARRARSVVRSLRAGRQNEQTSDERPPPPFNAACYAPTVSMYFDQFGSVRACCQNTGTLMGNVTEHSIREIWESPDTRRLRAALRANDYSEGCGFCQWQVEQGDESISFARTFDEQPVVGEHPEWPTQMEFSMTNSCNLQCVMCNGDWSSSIRAHREHRAPLPEVYGDEFFEDLADFLPHLRKTNFLGGEPFLGKEPLRVLNMLAELDDPPDVAVTTNGTQWSRRIEQICERLPISFVLSLDGITKDTYESIRIGADFDQVMTNLDRFQSYAQRHGTMVSLAHCLMRPNWHEFSTLLRFAEDRGLEVGMNEVLFPVELSLFQMPPAELRDVVESMERDEGGIAASLDRLRPVWDGQLAALRHRMEVLDSGQVHFIRPWGNASARSGQWEEQAVRTLTEWVGDEAPNRLVIDPADASSKLDGERMYALAHLGLDAASSAEEVVDIITAELGVDGTTTPAGSSMIHDVVVGPARGGDDLQFRIAWSTAHGRTTMLLAIRNPPPAPVLPEDPRGAMIAWCGAGRMLVLNCDPDDRIISLEGDCGVVGASTSGDLVGMTADDMVGRLCQQFGDVDLAPGPSGFIADSVATFTDELGTTSLRLRVMVDRTDDATTVYVGRSADQMAD